MLRTVLLLHSSSTGSHFDWLIAPPSNVQSVGPMLANLWAARVTKHSLWWSKLGRINLKPLPPHRRLYLTYQGKLSNRRGMVRRVDQGWVDVLLWTNRRIILDVALRHFNGRIQMRFCSEHCWQGQVLTC